MGSQSKINLSYIAGFLDGDGSLMLQIKKRKDGKIKWRFMSTICFYQDSRHENDLYWIRSILNIGYVSRRNDGMTELRVNGFKQVNKILENLLPFIRFKKDQAKALCEATDILSKDFARNLDKKDLLRLVDLIIVIQNNNYISKNKKTKEDILKILDLTP